MWRMFSANNNTVYWDKLDKLVDDYNKTYHYSIKMTPTEASKKENENKVFANLYGELVDDYNKTYHYSIKITPTET